jgi:nucleotide-binding universal stress UspA family protein
MSMARSETPRIVVGVDGSRHAELALRWALDEARRRGARLQVVHSWQYPVVPVTGFSAPVIEIEGIEEAARATLDGCVDAEDTSGIEVERILVMGPPAHGLLEAAAGADLLVVGSRGRGGFKGLLLGSVSQQCATHASCPVVIVPAGSMPEEETEAES